MNIFCTFFISMFFKIKEYTDLKWNKICYFYDL